MEQKLLISQNSIQSRVRDLASQISSDYSGKELIAVGMLNGAFIFFADIVREMTIPLKIDFIRAASYGSGNSSCGDVRLTKPLEIPIKDKSLLLIEDIVDTGLTLSKILDIIWEQKPESVKICALIDKQERREKKITVDYCGFKVKEGFLVGYGLDYNEQYRCLSDIYELHF
jgi:hypoxanthine phosphoribosyltransferase